MTKDILLKIEDLIVGKGSQDFKKLERLVDVFCPFEAIGMVRQEIRHAKYLAYIMDPNRPHGFGSVFLREFLMMVAEMQDSGLSKLDIHLMDMSNARVSLEWNRIDILIEIPNGSSGGIIAAVELKINATEGGDQLKRYKKVINDYKSDPWKKEFVFLTKNEDEASEPAWLGIGMAQLVEQFEAVFAASHFSGESADLFTAYCKMMRRRHLGNSQTENIARDLWSKHYEVLNFLMQYRPDRMDEIFTALRGSASDWGREILPQYLADEWSIVENGKAKFTVKVDMCEPQVFRFYVEEWSKYEGMLTSNSEVLKEKNILIFEMREWAGNSVRVFFLLTTGNEDIRNRIFDAAKADNKISLPKNTSPRAGSVKFLSADFVLNSKDFESLKTDGVRDGTIQSIRNNAKVFFEKYIPIYDEVLKRALVDE